MDETNCAAKAADQQAEIDLSVAIPLYNEEESAALLYEAVTNAVKPLNLDYEIIFVDDGSKDGTFEAAKKLATQDCRLRVIKFRRNYGQTPAMAAGIDNARGRIIITMDGDLQNDPSDIPHFLTKIEEGYDIVVGWRHKRKDKLITRKIPSKIANWLIGKVTGVPIKDNGCSLKAYRASLIKNIPLYSEMHRFIPAMASIAGIKVAEIKVKHHARQFGESKYGLSRIYKVLFDLLTIKTLISFVSKPLIWFFYIALIPILIAIFCFIYGVFNIEASLVPFGIGTLFTILAFFLVLTGLLGELIFNTGDFRFNSLLKVTQKIKTNTPKGLDSL